MATPGNRGSNITPTENQPSIVSAVLLLAGRKDNLQNSALATPQKPDALHNIAFQALFESVGRQVKVFANYCALKTLLNQTTIIIGDVGNTESDTLCL